MMLVNLLESFIISNIIVLLLYNNDIVLPQPNIQLYINIFYVKKRRTCPYININLLLKIYYILFIIYFVLITKCSMEHFNNYLINYYATYII